MRRLLLSLLLLTSPVYGQVVDTTIPLGNLGNVTTSTGVAGRCALFNGVASLDSDSGCTYSGAGNTFLFSSSAFRILGTAGKGYIELETQSSPPSTPGVANAARLFTDASGRFSWIGSNGFIRTFDATANTADRIYTLPNAAGTAAIEQGQPLGTGGMVGDVWRNVGSCTYANVTGTTTSTTSEEVARTCTIKGGTLGRDGISKLRMTASGTHAANTNATTVRWRFGGLAGTIIGSVAPATSGGRWVVQAELDRLTATTQMGFTLFAVTNTNTAAPVIGSPALTLASDNDLVLTLATTVLAGDLTVQSINIDAIY